MQMYNLDFHVDPRTVQ